MRHLLSRMHVPELCITGRLVSDTGRLDWLWTLTTKRRPENPTGQCGRRIGLSGCLSMLTKQAAALVSW